MKQFKPFTPAIHLGINIAVGMLFFAGVGYLLDQKFEQKDNLFTLVGMFFGLGYCYYEVWKIIQQSKKDDS